MMTQSQRDALQACRAFVDTLEVALVGYRHIFQIWRAVNCSTWLAPTPCGSASMDCSRR